MNRSLVAQIAELVNQDRCVLFVGPDLGESAGGFRGLPTSWQLADELAALCGYRGRFRSLPQIAQVFERERDRFALVDYLRERLDGPDYRPLPVHELIARIPFSMIVSGGWDTLLERALQGQQVRFHTVRRNLDLPYAHSGEKQLLLYKLYGSIDDPGSLLITEDDQLSLFYELERVGVVDWLRGVMGQRALLLMGYTLTQDTTFVRLYYEVRRLLGEHLLPAIAVQSLSRAEDSAAWQARRVSPAIEEPTTFLWHLAEAVVRAGGGALALPDPATLSSAPRLTPAELQKQAEVLNNMMDQIGVADLIEQTDVPLLSEEQLRDIEAMRAAYERLTESFAPAQGSARVWLRQGNLEYVRENYKRAEDYYRRALSAEPNLAEAHHNLHYIQLAQGNWTEAFQSYQRAVELQPQMAILPARYQIEKVLGGGGVGTVYSARDTQTGRSVAIKVLQRAKAQTEQVLAVFKREAHILQSLEHPNIVHLLDFQTYRGNYFIVMEYLEGQTLKKAFEVSGEPFALDHAFHLIEQVGEALEHAHARGIVHRDVKPSNIFLIGDQARLIDFGLARPQSAGEQSMLGAFAGTPSYLAPEQALGQPSDRRTDLYGLATVFYEMLTGLNPSQGTYRPPSELRPGLNSALDLVIEKARERDARDRYPSVAAFLAELRQVVATQAASERSPRALRLIARAAQGASLGIERGWPIVLAAIAVLGFALPELWPSAVALRESARYAAAALATTLLIGVAARPFTVTVARRARSAIIAAYGPIIGLLLGAVNSLLWLRGFSYKCTPEQRLGRVDLETYLYLVVTSLVLSVAVAVAAFLILPLAGTLSRRLGRSYAAGFFVAYVLLIGILLMMGISFKFGHVGDLSLITPECLEEYINTP
jgi:tetratricopeptide (TPR) repeat protein